MNRAQQLHAAGQSRWIDSISRRMARLGHPRPLPRGSSVASVFVSRWDKGADPLLHRDLHGWLGLADARKVYASYPGLLAVEQWKALASAGARPQRVLSASTSTRDPALPDTYYLGRLAAPDTVPEKLFWPSPTTVTRPR